MAWVNATAVLTEEHRSISKVVAAIVALADRLETGRPVNPEAVQHVVAFMSMVIKVHETKEEKHLFPAMDRREVLVHSVPAAKLVEEHLLGRALMSKLKAAAPSSSEPSPSAREALVQSLRGLAAMYPLHIWQEDLLLFHQANNVFSSQDNDQLILEFEAVDATVEGDVRERLAQMAEEILAEAW